MIEIRTARDRDAEAVVAFWAVAAENAGRPADRAAAVRRLLARDGTALLLATDGDALVGTIIAGWDGWRAHLYRLAVAPDRRRAGIGRRLLAAAEERLAAAGAIRLDAMVLDGNVAAHAVWSAAGYERQPQWSRWVKSVRSPAD